MNLVRPPFYIKRTPSISSLKNHAQSNLALEVWKNHITLWSDVRCALQSKNSRMWTWAVLITRLKLLAKTSAIHNRWVKAEQILIQTKSVTFSNGKVVFCFVNLLGFKYLRKVYPRLHESDKFLQTQVNNWKNKL